MKKSCENCKFLAKEDTGYSNWTVTDTSIICLKNVFEAQDESNIYRNNGSYEVRLQKFFTEKATGCVEFVELPDNVEQVYLDCDGETTIEDFKDDPQIYEAAKKYFE